MDTLVAVAFALLVLGVVGSLLPLVPGPLASLAGVGVYWWASGFAAPGPLVLAALLGLGLLGLGADLLGSVAGGRAGDVPTRTAVLAGLAGLVLAPLGPPGILLGVGGTVLLLELRAGAELRPAVRGAAFTTLGLLGSVLVQAAITATMLAAMLVVAFG